MDIWQTSRCGIHYGYGASFVPKRLPSTIAMRDETHGCYASSLEGERQNRQSHHLPEIDPYSFLNMCHSPILGHTPSTAGTSRKKFRKNSGKTPETLSERFLEFPSRARLGAPKPYNSRPLRLPEHFQNSLPPIRRGAPLFSDVVPERASQSWVMEFPAVLRVFLRFVTT